MRLCLQGLCGLAHSVDLIDVQSLEELAAAREVAVEGCHTDTGASRDLRHGHLGLRVGERGAGGREDLGPVALCIGPPRGWRALALVAVHRRRSKWTAYPISVRVKRTGCPPAIRKGSSPCTDNPVALVTGANKGIGLQVAKDLAAHGFTVVVGSRNLEAGEIGGEKRRRRCPSRSARRHGPGLHRGRGKRIRDELGRLDVLVNNAGISHADTPGRSLEEIVASGRLSIALDQVRTVFETNVFGVIAVTKAMLPLLRQAPAARIVNVASSGGSLTLNSDPANPHRSMFGTYSASKAAANAVTVAFAAELESAGIKVNAACPGFTGTDLNFFRGTRTVEQGAHEPVRLALMTPTVRRARSRTRMARSRGDVVSVGPARCVLERQPSAASPKMNKRVASTLAVKPCWPRSDCNSSGSEQTSTTRYVLPSSTRRSSRSGPCGTT